MAESHFIAGLWREGTGPGFSSQDPATGETVWQGRAATRDEVGDAVAAARDAFPGWAALSVQERAGHLEAFARVLSEHRDELAETLSRETGKPLWESLSEVAAMGAKIPLTRRAYEERWLSEPFELGTSLAAVRFRPHGVLAVLGPFNLPGHLPNGHIVPALLAGNTVVFKPSEQTPEAGDAAVRLWQRAGLPPGVLNLVQGGGETGSSLAEHPDLQGLLFTGSYATGRALHRAFAGHPEKLLALEMGGNNPLVAWTVRDRGAAVLQIALSAFITAGQRCTCARRLILPADREGDELLDRLISRAKGIRAGRYTDRPEPFIGPVISPPAAERLLAARDDLVGRGGRVLLEMERRGPALLTPGILDMTGVDGRPDEELFGPLLQVIRVETFDEAVEEANRTAYGLCAGILTDDPQLRRSFANRIRTGVVHWNRPTTGASGRLPFGGVGKSGNHRPSGYYAADYCGFPVATLGTDAVEAPDDLPPGL